MTLELIRFYTDADITFGRLFRDSALICYMVEPADRGLRQCYTLEHNQALKVPGNTAIPDGVYTLKKTWSPKFQAYTWEVQPDASFPFIGIRFHPGNFSQEVGKPDDTDGCLLPNTRVGFTPQKRGYDSKVALKKFNAVLDGNSDPVKSILVKRAYSL